MITNSSNNDYFGVKIVVIGGGKGSFTLLSGLKKIYTQHHSVGQYGRRWRLNCRVAR
ncbi:hypothetical protein KOY48_01735 [Candidatus Minimicrobia naudis]|uniref:Uncharacterized protein n=1 Tax=Candidatus Minimicrobia naudis TaxID=2841263 RepID=A0A8F1MBS7_9BACT|nr:hypothetical protein KOY48_01735 [Candidatus Minimicrobia naudis]